MECPRESRKRSNQLLAHCQIDHEYHVYNKFDSDWQGSELGSVAVLILSTRFSKKSIDIYFDGKTKTILLSKQFCSQKKN